MRQRRAPLDEQTIALVEARRGAGVELAERGQTGDEESAALSALAIVAADEGVDPADAEVDSRALGRSKRKHRPGGVGLLVVHLPDGICPAHRFLVHARGEHRRNEVGGVILELAIRGDAGCSAAEHRP